MPRRKRKPRPNPADQPSRAQPPPTRPQNDRKAPQTPDEEDALRMRIVRRILELRCKDPAKCGDAGCRRHKMCRKKMELDRRSK